MAVVKCNVEFERGSPPRRIWEFYLNDEGVTSVHVAGLGIQCSCGAQITLAFVGGEVRIFLDRETLESLMTCLEERSHLPNKEK